jgi:peptidase C13-like protein
MPPAADTPAPTASPGPASGRTPDSRRDSRLGSLLRLWTLRQAPALSNPPGDAWVAGLALAAFALWLGLDYLRAGPGARFEPMAIPIVALYAFLVLCVAFAFSRSTRPRAEYRSVLFVLVGLLPVLILAGFAIYLRLGGRTMLAAAALLCVYALAYLANALFRLTGRFQVRALLIAVVVLGTLYPASAINDLAPWLWSPAAGDQDGDADVPASMAESLLFNEREQIDEQLDAIGPVLGNAPAVFFVGFAGVAEQRVFAEEIKLAARVVGARFETENRQVLLINDRRDLDTFPIATASGLSYALKAVAEKMRPERDILFLALSSHGSPDPALSVSHSGLQLEQLSDEDLESALRESGIKRRIIVISACYAGAFLEPLENPDTIVIAAAAADRTSFGCSDDRDMTYFGEAFYRDALPAAPTLQEAFEKAKAAIAAREKEEHETPSEPQAYFGEEISAVLEHNPMRVEPSGIALRAAIALPDPTGSAGARPPGCWLHRR